MQSLDIFLQNKKEKLSKYSYRLFTKANKSLSISSRKHFWTRKLNCCFCVFSSALWYASLLLYWGIQGTFFTSIFVIGHDCGHDSFSNHKCLNDTVGTFMHSLILAPYYMWKLTHRIHHKNNANMDKDEVSMT